MKNIGTRTNDKADPLYREIEHSPDFEELLEYWSERGFQYDYGIGVFMLIDSFKGCTEYMTWEKALDRAIKETEDE